MEDVLDVYQLPYDPDAPVVCMDETSKPLVAEVSVPIPAVPGRAARVDYEYKRNGVVNVFMCTEPLAGWRSVSVTDRRAKVDWALAQHRGDRAQRAESTVPRPKDRHEAGPRVGGARVGGRAQQLHGRRRLAIHDRRRACEAQAALPRAEVRFHLT